MKQTYTIKKAAKKIHERIFVIVASIVILLIILIAGPAQAYNLDLKVNRPVVIQGDKIVFKVSVDLDSKTVPVSKLVLQLNGPENVTCEFNVNGSIISGCKGIRIVSNDRNDPSTPTNTSNESASDNQSEIDMSESEFGYGYGTHKKLIYNIQMDTENYSGGVYDTKLLVFIPSQTLSTNGQKITVIKDITKDVGKNIGKGIGKGIGTGDGSCGSNNNTKSDDNKNKTADKGNPVKK
ncbi:Uncharacterised protein [uncultured archaeon]|nr:Uncharacterised protein [uncultured archaeon]